MSFLTATDTLRAGSIERVALKLSFAAQRIDLLYGVCNVCHALGKQLEP